MELNSTVVSEGAGARTLYVLHGIFGSGRNWSSVIRRLVRERSEWAARLVDLRQHGASQGFEAPHTLEAAARDLTELAAANNERPAALLGHSFGGKVALMYAREHGAEERLEQVWVIDSTPEVRAPEGSAWQMLEVIRRMPREFASRNELIGQLAKTGVAIPIAQWMATNLELVDGRYRWRFNFDSLEEMLRDFFKQDLWDVLESPPGQMQIHVVKAQQSNVLSPAAIERVHQLSANGRVFLHEVPGGHWVNAESPDALLALMTTHL